MTVFAAAAVKLHPAAWSISMPRLVTWELPLD